MVLLSNWWWNHILASLLWYFPLSFLCQRLLNTLDFLATGQAQGRTETTLPTSLLGAGASASSHPCSLPYNPQTFSHFPLVSWSCLWRLSANCAVGRLTTPWRKPLQHPSGGHMNCGYLCCLVRTLDLIVTPVHKGADPWWDGRRTLRTLFEVLDPAMLKIHPWALLLH